MHMVRILGPDGLTDEEPAATAALMDGLDIRISDARALLRLLIAVKLYSVDVPVDSERAAQRMVQQLRKVHLLAELVVTETPTAAETVSPESLQETWLAWCQTKPWWRPW